MGRKAIDRVQQFQVLVDAGCVVGVGDAHALGLAGGARSVYQRCHVLGQTAFHAGGYLLFDFLAGLHAQAYEIVPEYGDRIVVLQRQTVVLVHHYLQYLVGMLLPVLVGHGILVLVAHEQHPGASVVDDEIILSRYRRGIDRNRGQSVAERT